MTGVLVMAHGTPGSAKEIEAFSTRIRRGRPPSTDELNALVERYEAIGGISPLSARTAAQVAGLATRLDEHAPGTFDVRFGAKHVAPFIEDTAADFIADGISPVIGLVLTPHFSRPGAGEYLARAATALAGSSFIPVHRWDNTDGLAELWAERVIAARATLDAVARRCMVLFTAHSIPEKVVSAGDPYPVQVEETARSVAKEASLEPGDWKVAYQSAGRTADPWLGPDLLSVLPRLADEGFDGVIICPVGFVADHLEICFDLDIEARRVAEGAGLAFARTVSFNDDPAFLAILAEVVRSAAGQ